MLVAPSEVLDRMLDHSQGCPSQNCDSKSNSSVKEL